METEKVKKLLPIISTPNSTELIELIYAVAKLIYNKIGVLLRNPRRNTKPERKIWLVGQVKKLQPAKALSKEKHAGVCWDEKTKIKQQTIMTMRFEEVNKEILAK